MAAGGTRLRIRARCVTIVRSCCQIQKQAIWRTILRPLTHGTFFCLQLLCSFAGEHSTRFRLPADVTMNQDAGRGGWLIVPVRLESGEEMPFVLDTGSTCTVLDKSLEPRLVKRPYTAGQTIFGVYHNADVCGAPNLYLGSVPLRMRGTNVLIDDFKRDFPGVEPPVLGLVGMDILQHYCIQLDFTAGKVRFLAAEHTSKKDWGKPFPLTDVGYGCFWIPNNLAGVENRMFGTVITPVSLVDTGCSYDGWMTSDVFDQWIGQLPSVARARFPQGVLGPETYPNILDLRRLGIPAPSEPYDPNLNMNGLGLHFLARHLVTLDFPNRVMYLKRTSVSALPPSNSKAALKVLRSLKHKGEAPFWSKDEQEPNYLEAYSYPGPNSIIITLMKSGDLSRYRYRIARRSKATPWKLERAWQTDQSGRMITEYPVAFEPNYEPTTSP